MYRQILFAISLLFITFTTFYIGFCLGILIKPEILKSGIITATFNFPNLHLRDIFPQDNIINSLQSEITSAAEITTAVVPAISQAQTAVASAVSSAVGAFETAVNSVIPKSCTLGTKYLCVSFNNYTPPCSPLPLNTSNPLSGGLADLSKIDQLKGISPILQSLQDLDQALSTVTTQYIEGYFAFGLASAIIALALGVIFSHSIWVQRQQYAYHVFGLDIPIVPSLRALFSFSCLLTFAIPSGLLSSLTRKVSPLPLQVKYGEIREFVIGAIILAAVMIILTIVTAFLEYCNKRDLLTYFHRKPSNKSSTGYPSIK